MKFDLTKPCGDCPFRNDITFYLRPERVEEILEAISGQQQATFTCHKTTGYDDESGETLETKDSQHCAGALILLEKIERPNQMMRWMERLGYYDRKKLDMDSPVYSDPEEMIEAFEKLEIF